MREDASRTLIADVAVRLGERLPVPAGAGPVWAEIEMEYRVPGFLAGLLLRPPENG